MATYYPTLSSRSDNFEGSDLVDQRHAFYSHLPSYVSNMTSYNQPSAGGSYSEIFPECSHNSAEIPSLESRNEMLFIPPTSSTMNLHSITGKLTTASGILDGGQNHHFQGLSLSLGTQMQAAVSEPSLEHHLSSISSTQVHTAAKWQEGNESNESKVLRNFEFLSDFDGGNQNNFQSLLSHKDLNTNRDAYEFSLHANTILTCKYLKATQSLLDEVVNVGKELKSNKSVDNSKDTDGITDNRSVLSTPVGKPSDPSESTADSSSESLQAEKQDLQNKKNKLLSMLDEVDRRYKQYYHQMQAVETSFDMVAGHGAAKSYTALALQTISRHFRSLRDAISGQIEVIRRRLGEPDNSPNSIPRLRYVDHQLRQRRALQHLGVMQHAWRPQRGLPESSVSILRAWLFEHFLHPYPNDTEKTMLARQTGLTRNQVANWFINARVRLWKPMVEEMYKEEFEDSEAKSKSSFGDAAKACEENNLTSEHRPDELLESVTSTAADSFHHSPYLEMRNTTDSGIMKLHCDKIDEHCLYPDENISHDQNVDGGLTSASITYGIPDLSGFTVGSQVSLALGLQPHESEAFPMPTGTHSRGDNITSSEAMDYLCMNHGKQQQDRFGNNTHLLPDFAV